MRSKLQQHYTNLLPFLILRSFFHLEQVHAIHIFIWPKKDCNSEPENDHKTAC